MSEKGEYGGGYDKTNAARDTGSSSRSVSRAWHDARDDAAKEGGKWSPGNRPDKSSSGSDSSGK